jgi:hypothetical protein
MDGVESFELALQREASEIKWALESKGRLNDKDKITSSSFCVDRDSVFMGREECGC